MENTKNLKKRVLALVLTVLMIVGVLPMSVFAVAEAAPTSDYKIVNTLDKVIDKAYNAESKYWKTVWSAELANLGSKSNNTGRTQAGYSGSYMELDPTAAGTIPANSDGSLSLPHDSTKTAGTYGQSAKGGNPWFTFMGQRHSLVDMMRNVWAKDLAGVDTVASFSVKLNPASTAGKAGIIATYQNASYFKSDGKTSYDAAIKNPLFFFECDGAGNFTLVVDSRTVATLPADEYFDMAVLFDYGGDDYKTAGRQYYVFVNGKCVAAAEVCDEANLKALIELQQAKGKPTAEGGEGLGVHPYGLSMAAFFFTAGAVYYDVDNIAFYQYDDDADGDVKDSVRARNVVDFVYYNDFDGMAAGTYTAGAPNDYAIYRADGDKHITYTDQTKITNPADPEGDKINKNEFQIVDENGNKVMKMNGGVTNTYLDLSIGKAYSAYKANSGKNFVVQFDLKGEFSNEQGIISFNDRMSTQHNVAPLKREAGGRLYIPLLKGENRLAYGNETVEKKYVGQLSKDEYTNIAVLMNCAENYVVIYIDGVDVSGKVTMLPETILGDIKATAGFENGYAVTEARMFYNHAGKDIYVDNIMLYNSDEYVYNSINADLTETFKILNLSELTMKLGGAPKYFNDFNNGTSDSAGAGGFNVTAESAYQNMAEIRNGAGNSKIADGVLAYASALDTSNNRYKGNFCVYTKASNNNAPDASMSGKNVVYQASYKLGVAMVAGTLASLNCTLEKGKTVGSNPVYVNASGELLLNTDGDTDGDTKIGQLTTTDFTTVAYEINPKANTVKVYIDGVNVGQTILLTEAQKTTVAGYASTYTNGFGVTSIGCYRESGGAENNGIIFYVDNIALYEANTYIKGFDCELYDTNSQTGYKIESDGIYYYENGVKKGNLTSEDGILTIDENGKVFFDTTPVTNLGVYYKYIGNEIVLNDGIVSGFYKGNSLLGRMDGQKYYYDSSKKLVVNAIFDIKDDDPTVTETAVGYVADENGVVTGVYTGFVTFADGTRLYKNGVRKIGGLVEHDSKSYYADDNGYLITGEMEISGVIWDFDATTFEGKIRDGLWIVDEGLATEYANLYINGVLQTKNSAESFATENPFTYKDAVYYIEGEGANLFKGDGVEMLGGIPYYFNGYIAEKVADSVVGGKYYDAMGNVVKEPFFLGKDTQGNDVWYHADSEGNLIAGYIKDDADIYYIFNAADDENPYAGKILDGVVLYDFDGDGTETYRFFTAGVITIDALVDNGEFCYIATANGDLYTIEADDMANLSGDWYVSFGEADKPYKLANPNGVYLYDFDANTDTPDTYRYFANATTATANQLIDNNGEYYFADANGDLIILAAGDVKYDASVDAYYTSAGVIDKPYVLTKAEGVIANDYDNNPDTPNTYRYFVNGSYATATVEVGGYWYVIDENGDLYATAETDRPIKLGDVWYVKGGENDYQLALANGVLVVSEASAVDANEHKIFTNGTVDDAAGNEVVVGDTFYKYDENGSLYHDYNNQVLANDGSYYRFDGYEAVLLEGYYTTANGFVWVEGQKVTDGVKFDVPGVDEMYFKDGKPSAGEIIFEDGSVHQFGEDGKRVIEEGADAPENKYPHSITIITQVKDGETVTPLSDRDLYRFWNTSFTYIPYYNCYGYTITVNGTPVTAAAGEILKVVIEASDENDHVIVVTFDKAVDYHTAYELVEAECTPATCMQGGINVYACTKCTRTDSATYKKEVPTGVDENAHDLETVTVLGTHTAVGTETTTCKHGCDYNKVVYTTLKPYEWVEVPGTRVEPGCGTNGSVDYECNCDADCTAVKTAILPATGAHNFIVNGKLEPTCSIDGAVYYKCADCGDEYSVILPATGVHTHDDTDSYTTIPDVKEGFETRQYNCIVCGAVGVINKTVEVDEEEEE